MSASKHAGQAIKATELTLCPVNVQPYEFVVGEPVLGVTLKKAEAEGGNGLFSGTSGPKPPQALSKAVIGMKRGGKMHTHNGKDSPLESIAFIYEMCVDVRQSA
eukprot:1141918-Pelagomonas_calceolata.AAC.1